MTNEIETLDLCRDQFDKPLLIEASAGTGKTFSLIHLLIRILIEKDISIKNILLVTFTRNATYEMKVSLHERLTSFINCLSSQDSIVDETIQRQIRNWVDNDISKEEIKGRLTKALEEIDEAPIYTIDAFNQQMLKLNQFPNLSGLDFTIGKNEESLISAIDFAVREELKKINITENKIQFLRLLNLHSTSILKFIKSLQQEQINTIEWKDKSKELKQETKLCDLPKIELRLGTKGNEELATALNNFFKNAVIQLHKLEEDNLILDFDDFLSRVESYLKSNPSWKNQIQNTFKAVLIDEFQDTNPKQFSIFQELFLNDEASSLPVIFVGDPKQSIYAFRGADLETYISARKSFLSKGYYVKRLPINYRSTPGLVSATNAIFGTSKNSVNHFIHPLLPYTDVKFTSKVAPLFKKDTQKSESYTPVPPLRVLLNAKTPLVSDQRDKVQNKDEMDFPEEKEIEESEDLVDEDDEKEDEDKSLSVVVSDEDEAVAQDIQELLTGNFYLFKDNNYSPVKPSDITVLVSARPQAKGLKIALRKRGIGFITSEKSDVLESDEAKEILSILKSIENPQSQPLLRNARSTHIIGEDLKSIIGTDDRPRLKALNMLNIAAKEIETLGVLTAFENLFLNFNTFTNNLYLYGGDRRLTNYEHILELLDEQQTIRKSIPALINWLEKQATSSDEDSRYLRREKDSDVIRIETIHGSKGLQYPIVYLLRATSKFSHRGDNIISKTREEIKDHPNEYTIKYTIDLRENYEKEKYIIDKLDIEESIRKLYVSFTRAKSHVVLPLQIQFTNNGDIKANNLYSPFVHMLTGSYEPITKKKKTESHERNSNNDVISNLREMKSRLSLTSLTDSSDWAAKPIREALKKIDSSIFSNIPDETLVWEEKYIEVDASTSDLKDEEEFSENKNSYEDLSAAPTSPKYEPSWYRRSFSGLTKDIEWEKGNSAGDETLSIEAEEKNETTDEELPSPEDSLSISTDPNSIIQNYRKSSINATTYGNWIHDLLKDIDFSLGKDEKKNRAVVHEQVTLKLEQNPVNLEDTAEFEKHVDYLTDMIFQVLRVPLFTNIDVQNAIKKFRLCDLDKQNKISEMEFLLEVGDPVEKNISKSQERKAMTSIYLSELLKKFNFHLLPSNTNQKPSQKRKTKIEKKAEDSVDYGTTKDMNGFLTGAIDLIFSAGGKFWIVDWKSNNIRNSNNEFKLENYTKPYLENEMIKHHYRLQILLYTIALKRYIESRFKFSQNLKNAEVYDYIGGAIYFFLRGVREKKPEFGLYFERPDKSLVYALDDALKNGYNPTIVESFKVAGGTFNAE